jgi:hypothetical protein
MLPTRPHAQATIGAWTAYCDALRPYVGAGDIEACEELRDAEVHVYHLMMRAYGDPVARVRKGGTP